MLASDITLILVNVLMAVMIIGIVAAIVYVIKHQGLQIKLLTRENFALKKSGERFVNPKARMSYRNQDQFLIPTWAQLPKLNDLPPNTSTNQRGSSPMNFLKSDSYGGTMSKDPNFADVAAGQPTLPVAEEVVEDLPPVQIPISSAEVAEAGAGPTSGVSFDQESVVYNDDSLVEDPSEWGAESFRKNPKISAINTPNSLTKNRRNKRA